VTQWFAEGTKTAFDRYRFLGYVPHGSRGYCCFVRVELDEDIKQKRNDVWVNLNIDERLARNKRAIESRRRKREKLLRGTLQARWEEALQADPDLVTKMVKNMRTRDE
jgi:hypothetical protein